MDGLMPPLRIDSARTLTNGRSLTVNSWKSATHTVVEHHEIDDNQEGKTSKFWHRLSRKASGAGSSGWKPLSLTTPILAAVIAVSLLIAATVELLAQRSLAHGGLALSPSLEEIPRYAMLSYLYGPNVVAVLYSLLWSWLDLDAKRMQPWFELSKPEGALAEDSLFLDYPFGFVAFVPFKAAKKRHWGTFLSGLAMVLVFWLITPLQSSLLGTDEVSHTEVMEIGNRSELVPVEDQVSVLGPEVMSHGYSVAWLGQRLPPFMTSDYGLLPFYSSDDPAPSSSTSNWTASTMKYSTELDCWPAEFSPNGPLEKKTYTFKSGKGCKYDFIIPNWQNYSMNYIGYTTSPHSSYWIGGPDCPPTPDTMHMFLAVWVYASGAENITQTPDLDITALYCKPSYYKQHVQVSIPSGSWVPIESSVQQLKEREELGPEEFNATAFEFLLANGYDDNFEERDQPFSMVVEQTPQVEGSRIMKPISNMVGFALAGQDRPTSDYGDSKVLHDAFTRAHKYLFSVALDHLLTNQTSISNTTATSTFYLSGIVVSRPISMAVEGLLIFVAVLAAILLWLCHTSPCHLTSNPSSINRLIDIFRGSPEIVKLFDSADCAQEELLLKRFPNERFRLCADDDHGTPVIRVIPGSTGNPSEQKLDSSAKPYKPIKPFAMRRDVGLLFVAILIGAASGLAYMKQEEERQTGLHRPSQNFELMQILENFVPTIFATLIEPFWVLLNRLLCVLQPFDELCAGNTKPSRSIDTTYTSIPPQLVVWRAIKSRHLLLVMVCSMALLANVMAVSLGALLNEAPIIATYPEVFKPVISTRFSSDAVENFGTYLRERRTKTTQTQDHSYIAMANITSGIVLPPWVSTEFFFQPHELPEQSNNETSDRHSLITRGFGANLNCTAVPTSEIPTDLEPENPYYPTECGDDILLENARAQFRNPDMTRSSGQSSVEFVKTLTNAVGPMPCDVPLTLGWGRTPRGELENGTAQASFAICRPILETAMFNVTIDSSGYVFSYIRTTDDRAPVDPPGSKNITDTMLAYANYQVNQGASVWHNDTVTRDWMSYLVVVRNGSRYMLDPKEPVPDPDDMIPLYTDAYRMLFSILLGLNLHLFEPPSESEHVDGIRFTEQTKIFLDGPAFIITMVVLALNIVGSIIFYARPIAFALPRMPTTIGSVLAYVAPSGVVAGQQPSRTFSFGRYIGLDGGVHTGIEMDPHVMPLDPASLLGQKKGVAKLVPFLDRKNVKNVDLSREGGCFAKGNDRSIGG